MLVKIKGLSILSIFLILSGCATYQPPKVTYVKVPNDESLVALNHIALKAERSAQVMAQIQNAQAKSTILLQGARGAELAATAIPQGWGQRISLNFQGPFDKAVMLLAEKARYQFFTEGKQPANIPLVTINAQNKTLKQILDDIVAQLPNNTGIVLHPRTRSILIIYNQVQGVTA